MNLNRSWGSPKFDSQDVVGRTIPSQNPGFFRLSPVPVLVALRSGEISIAAVICRSIAYCSLRVVLSGRRFDVVFARLPFLTIPTDPSTSPLTLVACGNRLSLLATTTDPRFFGRLLSSIDAASAENSVSFPALVHLFGGSFPSALLTGTFLVEGHFLSVNTAITANLTRNTALSNLVRGSFPSAPLAEPLPHR